VASRRLFLHLKRVIQVANRQSESGDTAPSARETAAPVYVPRVQPLLANQVVVPHGGMCSVPFTVDWARMRSVRVIWAAPMRRQQRRVEVRLDGELKARYRGRYLTIE
jgi:hypothetical protein